MFRDVMWFRQEIKINCCEAEETAPPPRPSASRSGGAFFGDKVRIKRTSD